MCFLCPLPAAGTEDHAQAEGKQQPGHLTRLLHKLLPTGPNEYAATMTDKKQPQPKK